MKTVTKQPIKVVILTENDNFVLQNYGTLTSTEVCEHLNFKIKDYRGITSKLSKLHLIETPASKKKREAKELLDQKNGNSFKNHNGVQKQIARSLVVKEINNSGIVGKVLGLPFETCAFELELLDKVSKDFTFVACEHKLETYYKLLQTVIDNKIKMSCNYGKFLDTVKTSKRDEYAHIFADFCGQFDTYADDIKTIFKNKLVQVGGTVAITVSNRNSCKDSILDTMNELNPIDVVDNNKTENGIKTFLTKVAKNNFALTKIFNYKDDERQSMLLYVLKRIK